MVLLTIKDFHQGIAESPLEGFGEIRNCELDTQRGLVRIGWLTTKQSGTTVTAKPLWFAKNDPASGTASVYAIDSSAGVYRSTDGGTTWAAVSGNGAGAGQGMINWKDYLFVFSTTVIDVYGPLSTSPTWTTNWQTTVDSDGLWHPTLYGQDDILYFGAGRYIGSIQEVAGQTFAPGTASTYTFTARALDLPADMRIKALSELGRNLWAGTWSGSNIGDKKVANIYPWDRTSDSFDFPIELKENGIQAMISIGNLTYFFAGLEGKCFVTNGSDVKELFRIPQTIIDISAGSSIQVFPGAMKYHNGKIIFGVIQGNTTNPFGHVWSYDLKSGALALENTTSTANANSMSSALFSIGRDTYLIGWQDGAGNKGIDLATNTARYPSYAAYVTSSYYTIGSVSKPVPLSEIEFKLANALASGEGIRLSYRLDLTSAFTTIDTFDFATNGAIQGGNMPLSVTVNQGIQFRAALTTGSSSTNTPELREIEVR